MEENAEVEATLIDVGSNLILMVGEPLARALRVEHERVRDQVHRLSRA